MLTLDALTASITAFFEEHKCTSWRFGKRFDSGASTRKTVETVLLTWDDAAPETRHIGMREAWVLNGGMEHGMREIHAQLWIIQERTFTQQRLTNVQTIEDVRAFLEANILVGDALERRKAELKRAEEDAVRQEEALQAALPECEVAELKTKAIKRLVDALGSETATKIRPLLRARLARLVAAEPF